jgi:hypothetical protein
MALPVIALRRLRTDTGGVVLPGCPVPGSESWSEEVIARRVRQGFVEVNKEAPKSKAKAKKQPAKAKLKKD